MRFGFIALMFVLFLDVNAQNTINSSFGKGLNIIAKDSSFSMKFSTRIQNRFDGVYATSSDPYTDATFTDKFQLRRARIKFDGWAFTPKVKYKMEFDVVNGEVLDAVVMWNFAGNFELWAGQTKLPGNRERVVSSQNLQFVDRSQLNSKFNIDRDKGLQLRHHSKLGEMLIREMASVSIGEGKNFTGSSNGNDYTARVEILPFGSFAGKGDYVCSDLKREKTPKLAIGVTYDYNDKAVFEGGQLGDVLSDQRDLSTVFADMMFKYHGVSVMAEYANKQAPEGAVVLTDSTGKVLETFYTGSAINAQLGYLFNNNWEVAGRYTAVSPEAVTGHKDFSEITFGVSKYVVGHSLKVQSDVTLRQQESKDDVVTFRFQVELAF